MLLLNERGEVCEGTITNVFIDIGEPVLVTPALDCGLLPGVLRGEMIDRQGARSGADGGRPARGEGGLCRQFAARAGRARLA